MVTVRQPIIGWINATWAPYVGWAAPAHRDPGQDWRKVTGVAICPQRPPAVGGLTLVTVEFARGVVNLCVDGIRSLAAGRPIEGVPSHDDR